MSLVAGTINQCVITAVALTTLAFLALGNGGTLALTGVILFGWLVLFWIALLVLAATAHVTGLLRLPEGETTDGH